MLIFIKMNKDLMRKIEITEGVSVNLDGNEFTIKKDGKELKKKFDAGKIKIMVDDKAIVLEAKGASKRESKMMGTMNAHLKNMIKGVAEDFVYELEICHVHFPMNVKANGNVITIRSFLGETTERKSKILDGAKVDIKGNKITVTGADIEATGQTAANLEKATKLTGRDRRIFQDGIFITKKPYRTI